MLKKVWSTYKHALPCLIYFAIYLIWFVQIEGRHVLRPTNIHLALDDYIPFLEGFVIPYFLWFPYVAGAVIYFFFADKKDYYKLCIFLFTGMTIFLIVSTLFPNIQHLRPSVFPRDNIFTDLIGFLYKADTATNIVPSIHVFNSIGVHIAVVRNQSTRNNKMVHIGSLLLCSSIVMSTMFIKQHSCFDVLTALVMAIILYILVYKVNYAAFKETTKVEEKIS